MIYPSELKTNDLVGLTCPAGFMEAKNAATCIQTLQSWGYEVMVGKTLGSKSKNYFSGTDDERRNELQAMLDDENIKAIFFGRGGYGMGRIIDDLDFKAFRKNPKWLIGFSDITVMHCHILKKFGIASMHAQMAAAYNDGGDKTLSVTAIQQLLIGKKAKYNILPNSINRTGNSHGILVGGNLSLFVNMIGTPSEPKTKDCILFLEDIGELLYNTDRQMRQLKRSGKLKNLAGLIFGGFTDFKDTERPFGKSIDEILQEIVNEYEYPVCYHFPVSHGVENVPLIVGGNYSLSVKKTGVVLAEIE